MLIIAVAIVYWLRTYVNVRLILSDSAYNIYLKAKIKATCGTTETAR